MPALSHLLHVFNRLRGREEETPTATMERLVDEGNKVADMMRHPGYEIWRRTIEETIAEDTQKLMELPLEQFLTVGAHDMRPKILAFKSALAVETKIIRAGIAAEERLLKIQNRFGRRAGPVAKV